MAKTLGKKSLLVFVLFFALAAPFMARGEQANVFVYHRFGDERYPSTNISLDNFEAHLQLLKDKGIAVLSLGEVVTRLAQGQPLPPECAVLTVDDGYKSFLTGAMPLLRRFAYPATLFVSTDAVGRPGFLSWQELCGLAQEGIEIGNHSGSHMHLVEKKAGETSTQWLSRVQQDVTNAQALFHEKMGQSPRLFSYPYGEYCPEVAALIKELGFAGAAGQHSGVVSRADEIFALPRFPMGGPYASVEGFASKLGMKAMPVKVVEPLSPLLGEENPPLLRVTIDAEKVDLRRLRCFVGGQENGRISKDPSQDNAFLVQAVAPLTARRTKYTLTAPSQNGKSWHWFSWLWIRSGIPE